MKCQTVTVDIYDEDNNVVNLVVPSYTVDQFAMQSRGEMILREYLSLSRLAKEPVSLGDFALYVLQQASQDPREQ